MRLIKQEQPMIAECDKGADTANLLSPEPQRLEEQELHIMQSMAEVLLDIFLQEASENGDHEAMVLSPRPSTAAIH